MLQRVSLLAISIVVTGCSSGGAAPTTIATADLSKVKLQFSVGTAVFPQTSEEQPINGPIINLVETLRQPNGASGLLTDSVAITGPAAFVVANQTGGTTDGGAPNQLINTLGCASAFGESLGVNITGVSQQPGCIPNSFTLGAGGPPAFPRTSDGNYPIGFTYAANIVALGGNPGAFPKGFPLGTYTMQVTTPPGSSESHAWTASARLASMTTLPVIAAPQLSFDGKGGGSVFFIVPPKITELFVSITAGNSCWPFQAATNLSTSTGSFSFFMKSPKVGPLTLAIPDNLGPPITNGSAPTFCSSAQDTAAVGTSSTGATVSVQLVGVDYPLYEMSYPQSTAQSPQITGSPQSDVTVSAPTLGTAP